LRGYPQPVGVFTAHNAAHVTSRHKDS
jgi:hypothetical protein